MYRVTLMSLRTLFVCFVSLLGLALAPPLATAEERCEFPSPGNTRSNCSLRNADLNGTDLREVRFFGVDFSGADMRNSNLMDALISGSNLDRADLRGADTRGLDLMTTTTSGTYLPDLMGIFFGFGNSILDFSDSRTEVDHKMFSYQANPGDLSRLPIFPRSWRAVCRLTFNSMFYICARFNAGFDLEAGRQGIRTEGSRQWPGLSDSYFDEIANRIFSDIDLSGINLSNSELSQADFSGTTAGIDNSPASRSRFTRKSRRPGVDFKGSSLEGANLTGVRFKKANFKHVRSGAITGNPKLLPSPWRLRGGYLVGPSADLRQANLRGVNLQGVDLRGAWINGAQLAGAKLNGVKSGRIQGAPASLPTGWLLKGGKLVKTGR